MPPAAYAGIMAGTAIYGAIQGSRKTDAEKATQNLSNTMSSIAGKQHSMAEPALQKAMQYYMTLASGNRTAIQGALAPSIQALNDSYKGGETRLSMMPAGPTRDRQMAEMERERVGKLGMMPLSERNNAMSVLLNQGNTMNDSALGYYRQQAGLMPQLNAYQQQRGENWAQLGQTLGTIFMPQLTGQKSWGDFGVGTKGPSKG